MRVPRWSGFRPVLGRTSMPPPTAHRTRKTRPVRGPSAPAWEAAGPGRCTRRQRSMPRDPRDGQRLLWLPPVPPPRSWPGSRFDDGPASRCPGCDDARTRAAFRVFEIASLAIVVQRALASLPAASGRPDFTYSCGGVAVTAIGLSIAFAHFVFLVLLSLIVVVVPLFPPCNQSGHVSCREQG